MAKKKADGIASLSPTEKSKLFLALLNDSELSYFAGKSKGGKFYRTLRVADTTFWLDSEKLEDDSYLITLGKEKKPRTIEAKDAPSVSGFSDEQLKQLAAVFNK